MTSNSPIILGIDPGFDRVGYAVGQKSGQQIHVLSFGLIQTQVHDDIFDRYHQIMEELTQVATTYKPSVAIIESLFFATNRKTALRVSEARGVIITTLLSQGLAIQECTPLQLKLSVTGYGKADKQAVAKMVRLQLKLPDDKIQDDVMDALGLLLVYR